MNHSTEQGRAPFSVSHLKNHRHNIFLDPRLTTNASLDKELPMKKVLPTLEAVTDDIKVEDEDKIQKRDQLIVGAQDRSKNSFLKMANVMKLHQPSCAPPLSISLIT